LGPVHARVRGRRPDVAAGQAPPRPRGSEPGLLARRAGRRGGRARRVTGRAPVKARLLDQGAISGVGNLLADQTLWQARISPKRPVSELSTEDLDRLRRELRAAVRSAIQKGGVHTGSFIEARRHEGVCPRDGTHLERAKVGGRTTYWCPVCQR
jgi:formamidopyrimidine-DNA glycosylase